MFSSQVSQSTSTVLVRSPQCGYLNGTYSNENSTFISEALALGAYNTYLVREGLNYIRACNESSSSLPSLGNCGIFGDNPFGKMSVSEDPCPFAEGACIDSRYGVIGLDTGLLDTNRDLGINTPHPIFLRKTTGCAPVQTGSYISQLVTNTTQTNGTFIYSYGPSDDDDLAIFTGNNDYGFANYTYPLLPSQQDFGNRFLSVVSTYQLESDLP